MWMNEHEVGEMVRMLEDQSTEAPNLYAGARVLEALVDWTNSVSDGWPYWNPPSKAAKTLQQEIHDRSYAIRFGNDRDGTALEDLDLSPAMLTKALKPIKAFLTKQGVDHGAALPWAALLPAA